MATNAQTQEYGLAQKLIITRAIGSLSVYEQLVIRLLSGEVCATNHGYMARTEYYHDVAAPQARGLLPAAFAVARNGLGRVLLVRRSDDGYWELPGGRVDVGESVSEAVVREVAEETGVTIKVTGLVGVYSDPGHVLVYPHAEGIYQQIAVCFHAFSPAHDAQPDHNETSAAAWFDPEQATRLIMHPAMRQRLTDALAEPQRAHFD